MNEKIVNFQEAKDNKLETVREKTREMIDNLVRSYSKDHLSGPVLTTWRKDDGDYIRSDTVRFYDETNKIIGGDDFKQIVEFIESYGEKIEPTLELGFDELYVVYQI